MIYALLSCYLFTWLVFCALAGLSEAMKDRTMSRGTIYGSVFPECWNLEDTYRDWVKTTFPKTWWNNSVRKMVFDPWHKAKAAHRFFYAAASAMSGPLFFLTIVIISRFFEYFYGSLLKEGKPGSGFVKSFIENHYTIFYFKK